jgi:hypothetical protein
MGDLPVPTWAVCRNQCGRSADTVVGAAQSIAALPGGNRRGSSKKLEHTEITSAGWITQREARSSEAVQPAAVSSGSLGRLRQSWVIVEA